MTRLLPMPTLSPKQDTVPRKRPVALFFTRFAVGLVVVTVAAYVAMEALGLRFCQPFHNEILYRKVQYFRDNVPGPDVVYLGNSQVHYGVMPGVVAAESKSLETGFNLAMPGTGLETSWLLARDVLIGRQQPKTLVLGVSPFMLAAENTEHDCQYWRYGKLTDLVEYVQADSGCPLSVLAAGPFRGLSNLAEFGSARWRKPSLETRPERLQQGHGGYWLPEQASAKQALPPERWQQVLDNFLPHSFAFSDDSRQALILRRFRDLAAMRNMRLVLLYPPQHTAFCQRLYRDGIETRYDAWVTTFCRNESIAYFDMRDPVRYPDADFEDPVHLNAQGADHFSRALAKVLMTP